MKLLVNLNGRNIYIIFKPLDEVDTLSHPTSHLRPRNTFFGTWFLLTQNDGPF
ncbi:hypothetical protein Plhal703r1_c08g0042561 [Plasmopara halstedii]